MQLCLSYCNGHNGTIPLNEDLEMPEAIKQCEHFRSCLESKNSSDAVLRQVFSKKAMNLSLANASPVACAVFRGVGSILPSRTTRPVNSLKAEAYTPATYVP